MKAMELYGCDVQVKIKKGKAYVVVLSAEKDSINEKKVMAVAKYLWDEGFIDGDEEIDVNVVYLNDDEGEDFYGEV